MPQIIRAEFLGYYNSSRNSDKVFNVFLIEDDDGTYACVSEYGRRGNKLLRNTLCTKTTRAIAESKLRQKLSAKRNHRETPYTDEPFGYNYSQIASEYGFRSAAGSFIIPTQTNQTENESKMNAPKPNVIAFPIEKTEKQRNKPKQSGILNSEQFDSLEI